MLPGRLGLKRHAITPLTNSLVLGKGLTSFTAPHIQPFTGVNGPLRSNHSRGSMAPSDPTIHGGQCPPQIQPFTGVNGPPQIQPFTGRGFQCPPPHPTIHGEGFSVPPTPNHSWGGVFSAPPPHTHPTIHGEGFSVPPPHPTIHGEGVSVPPPIQSVFGIVPFPGSDRSRTQSCILGLCIDHCYHTVCVNML